MTTLHRIPLFPLGSPLLPQAAMPLHLFEPRYRQLIQDLGSLPADLNALYDIGCIADIRAIQPYADGRFDIVTMGTERFILRDIFDEKSYFTADVEFLPDELGANPDAMSNRVRQHFERYREIVQIEDGQDVLSPDPTSLSWEVAAG
ncbi:MAG: LON peptidase substrate-binding domain-containing protein, partial [Actinobacteria bacterium]|nr:LON peptidase substrate-binding domain-containing protein [Actinomycetota bacterium]